MENDKLRKGDEMRLHLKIGTKVKICGYAKRVNGLSGTILARDGEYYKVKLDNIKGEIIYDIYLCELNIKEL